jgi:hypothetical protein
LSPEEKAMRAAARKAIAEAARKEEAERNERELADFEANRENNWNRIWAKALRLALICDDTRYRDWAVDNWALARMEVDFVASVLKLDSWGSVLTLAAMTLDEYGHALEVLTNAEKDFTEHLQELEDARRAAEELALRRAQALAKLSDDEQKLLNLR